MAGPSGSCALSSRDGNVRRIEARRQAARLEGLNRFASPRYSSTRSTACPARPIRNAKFRPRIPAIRRTGKIQDFHPGFKEHTMARIGAFCVASWLAAAILYFGQHSVAMIALSGMVAFGGFDLLRP